MRALIHRYKNTDSYKKAVIANFLLSFLGYHVAITISYVCIYLGLSFYPATPFNILLFAVYATSMAILYCYLKEDNLSPEKIRRLEVIQLAIWLCLYGAWCFLMNEQRVLTLLCAMMVMTFLFSYARFLFSIILLLLTSMTYLIAAYVGQKYFDHSWNMPQNLLHLATFFLTSSLIGFMVSRQTLQLKKQATLDFLTRLNNRRSMHSYVKQEFIRCSRFKYNSSLVMIDLDNFKVINDQYGHNFGDLVLKHVANILKEQLRATDYLARWGGEEFLALLIGTNQLEAQKVIYKVLSTLNNRPISFNDEFIYITFSAGITHLDESDSVESAIQAADKMLYISKKAGKARVSTDQC